MSAKAKPPRWEAAYRMAIRWLRGSFTSRCQDIRDRADADGLHDEAACEVVAFVEGYLAGQRAARKEKCDA